MREPRPFGVILRQIRLEAKVSQEELCHEAGFERTYIGRLERGERQPSLATVFAIAKALRIKASEIIARMEK